MPSKTITIREEVYHLLVQLKRAGESFSELLERLAKQTHSLTLLKKMRGSLDLGDTAELLREIRNRRENWRSDDLVR